jgi:hypothetical protein
LRRVSKGLGGDLHTDIGAQELRRDHMPQVINAEPLQVNRRGQALPLTPEVDRTCAASSLEDQAISGTSLGPYAGDELRSFGLEVQDPWGACFGGLAKDRASLEVDVLPAATKDFGLSRPSVQQQLHED